MKLKNVIKTSISKADSFQAGNIKPFLENWKRITSDKYILDIVKHGLKLEFLSETPHGELFRVTYNTKENGIISQEISKLLKKKVTVQAIAEKGDFFSSVFLRAKRDESFRMILNLKKLNKCIDSKHVKMESLQNVLHMVKSGVWMASVVLKAAYYSLPIHEEYQKYLKFLWECRLKFIVMPNGYGPATRAFTKLMKPPVSLLRSEGYLSVIYVEDCYLQGDSFTKSGLPN